MTAYPAPLLFVCTANLGRSPFAEFWARKHGLQANSAGLAAGDKVGRVPEEGPARLGGSGHPSRHAVPQVPDEGRRYRVQELVAR